MLLSALKRIKTRTYRHKSRATWIHDDAECIIFNGTLVVHRGKRVRNTNWKRGIVFDGRSSNVKRLIRENSYASPQKQSYSDPFQILSWLNHADASGAEHSREKGPTQYKVEECKTKSVSTDATPLTSNLFVLLICKNEIKLAPIVTKAELLGFTQILNWLDHADGTQWERGGRQKKRTRTTQTRRCKTKSFSTDVTRLITNLSRF